MPGINMKPRESYVKALVKHNASLEAAMLRANGWETSDWTEGTTWEREVVAGRSDPPKGIDSDDYIDSYLIASERDGYGGKGPATPPDENGDYLHEDLDYAASGVYVTRYACDTEGNIDMGTSVHDLTVREAIELVELAERYATVRKLLELKGD